MVTNAEEFRKIAKTCNSRKEFIQKVKSKHPNLSTNYVGQVWYKVRNNNSNNNIKKHIQSKSIPKQSQPSEEETDSEPESTSDESSNNYETQDVNVETPIVSVSKGENTESVGLKDIYGRMFEEEGSEDAEDSDSQNEEEEDSDEEESDDGYRKVKVSPSRFLVSIAQGINDSILYGGVNLIGKRKLTNDEISDINSFSEAVAKKDLKMLEDQPELNYFIASFIVPAINRSDLYIEKIKDFIAKHPTKKQQQQQQNATNIEASQPAQNDKPQYSQQQQQTIEQWIKEGFKIDPKYNFTQTIDVVAYRDLKIIRNLGSTYA